MYNKILNIITDKYSSILGNNLIGIYVHGSIAFGCFNWDKSDIDIIVVVDEALDFNTKIELMNSTVEVNKIAPQKGIEMSVVLKKYCSNFIHPTPFELHFSNMHLNWYNTNPEEYCEKMKGDDGDLAAHFTIIKAVGIVLYGEDIDNVFGDISKEYYIDSIKSDIENAKDEIMQNPIYIILNLCRVLAFVNDDLVLSKEQGGKWGLQNTDSQFRELIDNALKCYMSNDAMVLDEDKKEAMIFCDYMHNKIFI